MKLSKVSIAAALLTTVTTTASALTVEQALPQTHNCSSSIDVRANSTMTSQQLNSSCNKMTTETGYFHQRLETNGVPIANDTNDVLKVYLFANVNDYKTQAATLFDMDTNNGGAYLEGEGQWDSEFAAYQAGSNGDVWNLKHEYVHYLDGRFVMEGGLTKYPANSVWWAEGLGEYISLENNSPSALATPSVNGNNRTLAQVFATTYTSSEAEVYDWGYLGVRFMFEKHMPEVRELRDIMRAGNYSDYQSKLTLWGPEFEQEWQNWLIVLAGGTVEPVPPVNPVEPPNATTAMIDKTISAKRRNWADESVVITEAGVLTVSISGGSGDADLYVQKSNAPTTRYYDCRPYEEGNEETCVMNVTAGTYYIGVRAYQSFSNVQLVAEFK